MKLCFSTIGCPDWTFGDIVSTAKDLGYNAVEIRGIKGDIYAPDHKEFGADWSKTKKLLDNTGIKIAMLTSGAALANFNDKVQSVGEAKNYIDLAAKIGAQYVRVMSTDKPFFDGGDIKLCEKQYKDVVKYSEGTGVTPLMETNGMFVDTKLLASFLDEVGGNSGALWDINHPFRYNDEKMSDTVENLGDKIKYVHLKDSVFEKGQVAYRMMGAGTLPIAEVVSSLKNKGYNGYFTFEWVKRWNRELEDAGIVFAHFVSYMQKFDF